MPNSAVSHVWVLIRLEHLECISFVLVRNALCISSFVWWLQLCWVQISMCWWSIINMLNWSVVSLMLWEWWLEVREAKRAVYVGLLIWKIICPFDFKSLWLSSAGGEITSHCCEDWRESQSSSSCLLINQLCQRETASKRSHHYIIAQISYSQRQHQCSRCHNIL